MRVIGAGSTFAAPIYAKWGDASSSVTSIKLNYHTIGSGAGINQVNNRTVDFGASDMPAAADQLEAQKLMQFPTVIGGVESRTRDLPTSCSRNLHPAGQGRGI